MYLAHACCASDGGPYLVVDSVRRVQPPLFLLLLPSLSFFFFSPKPMAPLTPIELSRGLNFKSLWPEIAYT
jgi:hypothetical protein